MYLYKLGLAHCSNSSDVCWFADNMFNLAHAQIVHTKVNVVMQHLRLLPAAYIMYLTVTTRRMQDIVG